MRNAFINTLYDLCKNDENTFLITGDLGFGVLTRFWETYPYQFINAGISEQNMTSVATGMALEGKKVFTYSIANFPTLRCLEQIRNDVAYHDANVKIVSIGAGFAYGGAGMSHHATEDLAVIRAIPNIVVFSPADPLEAAAVTKAAYSLNSPCYIRLGKGGEKTIHSESFDFEIGKAIKIADGEDVCIFSTGSITSEAIEAVEILNRKGIRTALYTFPTIKPIDEETISICAEKYKVIVTVEEHNIVGGFGGAIAEVMASLPIRRAFLVRIGLQDTFSSVVGTQDYLRDFYQMSCAKIVQRIEETLSEAKL